VPLPLHRCASTTCQASSRQTHLCTAPTPLHCSAARACISMLMLHLAPVRDNMCPARLQHNVVLLIPHRLVRADACMHLCVTLALFGCPRLHPSDRAACAGSLPHTIHVPTCVGSAPEPRAYAARYLPDSRACASWPCGRNAHPPTHLSASLVESARPPCMRCTQHPKRPPLPGLY
jgi:hypothetical protein